MTSFPSIFGFFNNYLSPLFHNFSSGSHKKASKKGGKKKTGKKDDDEGSASGDDEAKQKKNHAHAHAHAQNPPADESVQKPDEKKVEEAKADPLASNPNAKKCTSCNAYFETSADFKAHYKTEWHKFNTKRKTDVR